MSKGDDIERFARLRARIEERQSRDQVLAEAGLGVPQWLAMQRSWLQRLTREAERGQDDLAKRYRTAFAASCPATTPEDAGLKQPPPSVAQAPTAPAPTAPAPTVPAPTAQAPVVQRAAAPAKGTARMPMYIPASQARFAGQSDVPVSVADEVAAEAAAMVGATAMATPALSDEQLAEGLASPERPDPSPTSTDLDATAAVMRLDIEPSEVLPFSEANRPAPSSAASEVVSEGMDLAGETAFVPALSDEDLAAPQPFLVPGEPPGTGDLTLEQYTSLVVEVNHQVDARERILLRYGVTEDGFVQLKSQFNRSFADDPTGYGKFRMLYDQYSAWWGSRR